MFRRRLLVILSIISPLLTAAPTSGRTRAESSGQASEPSASRDARRLWLYVGTYTVPATGSKGIYLFEMDIQSGELKPKGLAAEAANPSFLAVHPNHRFLYAAGELAEFQGTRNGAVSAFALDAKSGMLTLLNQQPSGGQGPCYVTVTPDGRYSLTANYTSGTVAVLPISEDGRLAAPAAVAQHKGSGPNTKRQQGPHAHSISLDPAGRFALAADLGADKVFAYRLGAADGSLTPADPPAATARPGAGPRHLAFAPDGRFAYVNNELASTITVYKYDAERGRLSELQTTSSLPEEFKESNTTADVHVHPSGRFLYCSNRGHDSIAIFTIDRQTGRLTAAGHESTRGQTPRGFGIDPSGAWLVAANQKSNSLVVMAIDPRTGALKPNGRTAEAPCPVCVKFVPVSR